jgi:hypothetical protein
VVWLVVGIVSFVLGEPLWGVVGLALGVALTLNGVFRKRWRRSV